MVLGCNPSEFRGDFVEILSFLPLPFWSKKLSGILKFSAIESLRESKSLKLNNGKGILNELYYKKYRNA